jgi:hypothetical protein
MRGGWNSWEISRLCLCTSNAPAATTTSRFDLEGGDDVKLLAKEAVVKTAVVEVKSLLISGKQVTLSVFRQLIKEPLVDPETAELHGVPWGRVNYFLG